MAVFRLRSVTLKVFVVVPKGQSDPEGRPAICVTVNPLQLSEALGAEKFTIAPAPLVATAVTLPGQEIVGATASVPITTLSKDAAQGELEIVQRKVYV